MLYIITKEENYLNGTLPFRETKLALDVISSHHFKNRSSVVLFANIFIEYDLSLAQL